MSFYGAWHFSKFIEINSNKIKKVAGIDTGNFFNDDFVWILNITEENN
ncbi:hypothetical protein BACCIP111895_03660 [Neobacillus rhizosphaerae]|uniref:Uncharacterized protein n=1 Tax=Neobacillus rhizosphaerae TaxID=2880965 RepID=A0ABM9EUX5_9BACI|nr:hypothetical protein BACCIP111895_03660 [Neobacillus rhizosphaerae]